MPYKAENWNALSYEQYFLENCFLDICRCAFKQFLYMIPSLMLPSVPLGIWIRPNTSKTITLGTENRS